MIYRKRRKLFSPIQRHQVGSRVDTSLTVCALSPREQSCHSKQQQQTRISNPRQSESAERECIIRTAANGASSRRLIVKMFSFFFLAVKRETSKWEEINVFRLKLSLVFHYDAFVVFRGNFRNVGHASGFFSRFGNFLYGLGTFHLSAGSIFGLSSFWQTQCLVARHFFGKIIKTCGDLSDHDIH